MAKPAREYLGGLVHYLVKAFDFNSSGQFEIGTLPAGATMVKPVSGVSINTAFNAATTNTFDIGTSANATLYASALAAGSVAFVPLDEVVSQTVASATTLYGRYNQSGTAATAGAGVAIVAYVLAS